jgi:glucose/arabinose dehydrogenase
MRVRGGGRRFGVLTAGVMLSVLLSMMALPPGPALAALPEGFVNTVVFSGLEEPTALAFAPDGRVFVTEQAGLVKVFDGVTDTTPDVFADLQATVHNVGERGLLGLAINPDFPADPYVHVVYSHDAPIGGTAPHWNDACGATGRYCTASGRLSRLRAEGNHMVGAEEVLIEDWCSSSRYHSVAGIAFGPEGALYVGGGEGGSSSDYGQEGDPPNPCGDPPVAVGETPSPPNAQGGSLRAQDLRTPGDPVTLDGSLIRVDPATGAAWPGNPLVSDPDANAKRILAHGLRVPFRLAFRPGTSDLWIADVGSNQAEELNRLPAPGSGVANFGWPCYEGQGHQADWEAMGLQMCTDLYGDATAVTPPSLSYDHGQPLFEGDTCPVAARDAVTALAFYQGGAYPDSYDGALFFGDYARHCMWFMHPGPDGQPDPGTAETFASDLGAIVDLEVGPEGDLFYVDVVLGEVHRISYGSGAPPPTPSEPAGATPTRQIANPARATR